MPLIRGESDVLPDAAPRPQDIAPGSVGDNLIGGQDEETSEKLEQELLENVRTSGDPLGEAARRGAQLILQKALETEVDEFLRRGRYERSEEGGLRGYRNGYEPKRVHSAEGTIELQVPQVRETLEPFESVWLQSIGKRSKKLLELV